MGPFKVLTVQFPFKDTTHSEMPDWVLETTLKMRDDPRIGKGNCFRTHIDDTPVTVSRNRALVMAKKEKIDYVLMLDEDNVADLPYEGAIPFWEAAWEFAMARRLDPKTKDTPHIIAAPYCGPPPDEHVYVFRWVSRASGDASHGQEFRLDKIPRHEAAGLKGIQRAAALATGVMLIDMRAVARMPDPYFYYEYTDKTESRRASTEDVTFTRDATMYGVECWATFDSWAGHIKNKLVGKPIRVEEGAVMNILNSAARDFYEAGVRPPPQRIAKPFRAPPPDLPVHKIEDADPSIGTPEQLADWDAVIANGNGRKD